MSAGDRGLRLFAVAFVAFVLGVALTGCSGGGVMDVVNGDASDDTDGVVDDGGPDDGGPDDGGSDDGSPDDGSPDDGSPDDGSPDDGSPDDGSPDDGSPDDGSPDDGGSDDGSRSTGWATAFENAAQAKPGYEVAGVIQSSNVDDLGNTEDQVEVDVEYAADGHGFEVVNDHGPDGNRTPWSIGTGGGSHRRITARSWPGVALSRSAGGAVRHVEVYSDIESASDADYLALGAWWVVPDRVVSISDYEVGAFADGNRRFYPKNGSEGVAGLTGTARYEGIAVGVLWEHSGSAAALASFDGSATVTVDFDTGEYGTVAVSIAVNGGPLDGMVRLESSDIDRHLFGSFRKGSLTVPEDGQSSVAGRWGGRFFGGDDPSAGKPVSVAGTFAGFSADGTLGLVGAFGADRTDEQP